MVSFVSKAINHCCWSFNKLCGAFFSACLLAADLISQKCITQDWTLVFVIPESAVRRCDKQTDRQTDTRKWLWIDPHHYMWFGENLYGFSIAQHNSEDFYFQLHIHIWSNPCQFLYSACYSTSHLHSEMFERQKAFFIISLNRVAFIHNGRFQIIELIKGFILDECTILYYTVLWLNLVDRIFLTD